MTNLPKGRVQEDRKNNLKKKKRFETLENVSLK
jgi:hypothetical protein